MIVVHKDRADDRRESTGTHLKNDAHSPQAILDGHDTITGEILWIQNGLISQGWLV